MPESAGPGVSDRDYAFGTMPRYLVVADEPWVRNEVHAALTAPDVSLVDHSDPATAAATATEDGFDAVICDLQVGSRGGMAVTRDVLERAAVDGADAIPVVLLLDRSADAFLARRAGASAWVAKPFSSYELVEAMALAADGNGKQPVEAANTE